MYTSVNFGHFKVHFFLISLFRVARRKKPDFNGQQNIYCFGKKISERLVLEYLQNYGKVTLSLFLPELWNLICMCLFFVFLLLLLFFISLGSYKLTKFEYLVQFYIMNMTRKRTLSKSKIGIKINLFKIFYRSSLLKVQKRRSYI